MADHPLILFDGVCNLCNHSVDFIIRRDPQHTLRFAALQSAGGQQALKAAGLDAAYFDSLVLLEGGRVSTHSTGALRIAKLLGWPWKMAYVFMAVPRPLRDSIYRFVGKRRYRWFGKRESCRLPTPAEREQFVSDPADAVKVPA